MKSIQIDPSRLLGFRLSTVTASSKIGSKIGNKPPKIEIDLTLASAKIGNKAGRKS